MEFVLNVIWLPTKSNIVTECMQFNENTQRKLILHQI